MRIHFVLILIKLTINIFATGPAVTDVAGEMDALTDTLRDCKACHKACVAAVEMLAVRKPVLPMVVAKDQ